MGYYSDSERLGVLLHNAKVQFNKRPTVPLAARIDELKRRRRFWQRVARASGVREVPRG